jgi:hypothetical protein
MIAHDVIAFIFKVINFGALFGLGAYFFCKKFKKQIKAKIEEKEVFWHNLKTNKINLINQQNVLTTEISIQQQYAQELLKKIAQWKSVSLKNQELLSKDFQENADRAYKRALKVQDFRKQRELFEHVAPRVLKSSHEELDHYYGQDYHSEKYLGHIINFMEKEKP